MRESVDRLFLNFSIAKLNRFTSQITDCLSRLREDQIWTRGTESENAIGNLVLHAAGNMRQQIISAIGGAPDTRVRDREFSARGGVSAPDLAERIRTTVAEAVKVLDGLTADRLCDPLHIQNRDTTVLEAVYHVVEHLAQHTGQIIFATKLATGSDLGYSRRPAPNA